MLGALYSEMESISIDYGVLEKSKRLAVLPADIGWSDLGDWTTIHSLSAHDERGNTLSPQVIDKDSRNSFVHGNGRTIATIGLENIVVIDTDDAFLVCSQSRTQEVKTIVQQLQDQNPHIVQTPPCRPAAMGDLRCPGNRGTVSGEKNHSLAWSIP